MSAVVKPFDVTHSSQLLQDLGATAVAVIHLVKSGIGLGSLGQLVALSGDVKKIIADAPAALPELKGISAADASALAEAAYAQVKAIIAALA
jgi:hypothetical protein